MALKKSTATGIYCVAGIGLFFLALVFLPPLFRKTTFDVKSLKTPMDLPPSLAMDTSFSRVEVSKGKPAVAGKTVTLRSLLKDKKGTLLVNFWATWCPPCVQELPSLEYLGRQLKASSASDITLVTISVDEALSDITALFSTTDFNPTFPILFDCSGVFAASLGTTKFPETYWIDADGKILYKWVGPQDWMSYDVLERFKNLSLVSSHP